MRCLSFRLVVAIFTFVTGIIAASVWWHIRSSPPVISSAPAQQQRKYMPGNHYDAGRGALQEFSSSDGRSFRKWTLTCGSPEGARREMEGLLKKSQRVVSREPVFDARGRQVGEEVVAEFPADDTENGAASLFHVGESEYLIQVTSTSLQNILEFRNDFRR